VITITFACVASLREKSNHVAADQLRAVDGGRIIKRLGNLSETTLNELLGVLQAMFAM
jgi:mRNA-degrading endonuclease toxin of MazEF toxin-antitoxin module